MSRDTRTNELRKPTGRLMRTLLPIRDHYLLYKIILLATLLSSCHIGHCLQRASPDSSNASTTTTTTSAPATTLPAVAATTTTTPSSLDANDTTGSELILSAEEFVDAREVPLIVIDGTANEDSPTTTTRPSTSENATQGTSISATTSSDTHSSQPTASPTPDSNLSNQNSPTTTIPTITSFKLNDSSADSTEEGGGDDDEEADDETDSGRLLPNEQAKGSFEPPQNISQYMDYIEKLFHDLRHQITHLFEPHLPQLIRTSQMVELTSSCSYDMLRMALALRQFEPWALRMIDSSGKVPEGIFEGSFTALGSYDECLSTVFQSASSHSTPNEARESPASSTGELPQDQTTTGKQVTGPTQGKYCLVTVSPFMPPKPPADKVERLFQEEANRRNYTRDDQFSRLSPMFYYMKFRIGVCMPSTCDQTDMDSISSALSSSLRLNITIPDCRVKQTNQELSRHQLVGGLTFALVFALVLLATLIDCFKLKWKQLEHQDIEFIQQEANKDGRKQAELQINGSSSKLQVATTKTDKPHEEAIKIKIGDQTQLAFRFCNCDEQNQCHNESSTSMECATSSHLMERLGRHWAWMSFSLITNFRLYFQRGERKCVASERRSDRLKSKLNMSDTARYGSSKPYNATNSTAIEATGQPRMIACLNGIRVLSLCWVIVANSYLTLDPRATKRLTKTREAPRDFLFQLVVQASLAIETFFFLSGLLMSLSFSKRLRPSTWTSGANPNYSPAGDQQKKKHKHRRLYYLLEWVQFYVHRYVRMTPPTMLVIAFSMYAYHYGDGPLWFEATQRVHQSCTQNWWRHLLHVANFIDTRQMCFIHYWYIAADMQLFLFAPVIMFLLFKFKYLGHFLIAAIGGLSIGSVFHTTYTRSLPPTLLFYSTDPESRREFGNTIMTKPMTHAMPYLVGMLVGWWCVVSASKRKPTVATESNPRNQDTNDNRGLTWVRSLQHSATRSGITSYSMAQAPVRTTQRTRPGDASLDSSGLFSATGIFGWLALAVALVELFLPYMWNNSHLPGRLVGAIYAALFRFGWSLVLAYVVLSCRHRLGKKCKRETRSEHYDRMQEFCGPNGQRNTCGPPVDSHKEQSRCLHGAGVDRSDGRGALGDCLTTTTSAQHHASSEAPKHCYCGSGGNYLNRLLSLEIFAHLSKLSFVAYLIHLPLMSVFIGQTRGLFAFSHTLVIHFAISYLVISFALSFLLVHFIEFPFITFERLLFDRLFRYLRRNDDRDNDDDGPKEPGRGQPPMPNTLEAIKAHEKHLFYQDPRTRPITRMEEQHHHQHQQQLQQQRQHDLHQPASHRSNLTPANQLHRTTTGANNHNHITTERL